LTGGAADHHQLVHRINVFVADVNFEPGMRGLMPEPGLELVQAEAETGGQPGPPAGWPSISATSAVVRAVPAGTF